MPFFAIPNPPEPHDGTKDVDLVLDSAAFSWDCDETMCEILEKACYQQDMRDRFR